MAKNKQNQPVKKQSSKYPGDFKTVFGLSTMGLTNVGASAFMTSMFMLYLTDYSGIGAYAATLGTILLLVGRLVDAFDDPLQGWIMDSAKPGKYGKYKPFIIISIIVTTVSLLLLYSLPTAISQNPVLVTIWVLVFYLAYDIGMSFYADNPLKASLTDDPNVRSKIAMWPRVVIMFAAMPFSFFVTIMTAVNGAFNNMHTTFIVCIAALMIPYGLVSLLGISLVKEGPHKEVDETEAKLSIKEIIAMFKQNKAQLVLSASTLFGGFVYTLIFATATYYLKWAYCTDLTTGAVDSATFGTLSLILGMMQMTPILLGAFLGPVAIRKAGGDAMKVQRALKVISVVCGLALFVLQILGILQKSCVLFFIILFVMMFGVGMANIPASILSMECIDYGFWKSGKEMGAICTSLSKFIEKLQTAVSSAMVGVILIAVGYQVDSVTDTFTGDLASVPRMLTGFIVVCGLAPAILDFISWLILGRYPINNEVRTQMNSDLAQMKKSE